MTPKISTTSSGAYYAPFMKELLVKSEQGFALSPDSGLEDIDKDAGDTSF